jgi:hypothetical protein
MYCLAGQEAPQVPALRTFPEGQDVHSSASGPSQFWQEMWQALQILSLESGYLPFPHEVTQESILLS